MQYSNPSNFELALISKFTLGCLHTHLDCNQLLALALNEREVGFCVSTLKAALLSPDLKGNGIALHEMLQILVNLTHPACSVTTQSVLHDPEKSTPNYFSKSFATATEKLAENSRKLIEYDIASLLEKMISEGKCLSLVCRILWHLLHHEDMQSKIAPETCGVLMSFQDTISQYEKMSVDCCLWLLGLSDKEGTYNNLCIKNH